MRQLIAAILLCLAVTPAAAQTTDTASVRGTVNDAAGGHVAGAEITLADARTGVTRRTTSDSAGTYAFGAIPVTGTYTIRISMLGFAPASHGPFALRAGETATINPVLQVAASGDVTVFGTAEGVRSDSPELGTRIDERALQELPVIGRKLTSVPLLNSAVRPARGTGDLFLGSTLFVINGGGRRQTTYALDGSTGDDMWGRQTLFTSVPLATVRELTVLTNAFSAEYGRSTGSAVNVVTQSGGNELRGDVSLVYRPSGLQRDQLEQFSGMVSGPMVKDRTHFLVGGELNAQDRRSQITSPAAPGFFTGDFRQALAVARVDHQVAAANHLVVRANADRLRDSNPADAVGGLTLASAARTFRRATASLQASDAAVLRSSLFNEARVIAQWGAPISEFQPATPSTQFVRPGVSTEGESRAMRVSNRQLQFAETGSWAAGRHSIRAGGDFVRSRSGGDGQEFGGPFVLGQFTFKPGIPASVPTSNLTIADVQRFAQGFGSLEYAVTDRLWSLFLQDDWRPLDALTLNLGLRYDRQSLTDDTDNLAPRLGFVWAPDDRTAVRGGYGVYFSQLRANLAAGWALNGPEGFFTFSVAPGQLGFPAALQPLPSLPAGANLPARDITVRPGRPGDYAPFFDVSQLRFYPGALRNPRTQQQTIGVERQIADGWLVSADVVAAHTTGIERNLDANAPAPFIRTQPGQTRSAAAADATRPIAPVANGYRRILVTVNGGEAKYRGVQLNVRKSFQESAGFLASYTWSHTTNNVEPDAPGGDPNDVSLLGDEWADSLLDQRHRGVLTAWHRIPFDFVVGAVATAASGRPFNVTTGVDNNGDAAATDRPVIDGKVVGRNSGRGSSIFTLDAFLEKEFRVSANSTQLALRVEGFNLTNRRNVVGRNGVYGNGAAPLATFGQPLGGISNVDPMRQVQLMARVRF